MRGPVHHAGTVLALAGACAVLGVQPAAAANPGTLTGETLSCGDGVGAPDSRDPTRFCPPGSGSVAQVTCDPTGESTFRYDVRGPATGPYSGTFSEAGMVKLGPPEGGENSDNARQVRAVEAEFRVDSPAGVVSGRKRLTAPLPIDDVPDDAQLHGVSYGLCLATDSSATGVFAAGTVGPGGLCYEARLPDGTLDRGTSTLQVGRTLVAGTVFDQFIETYTSNSTVSCGFPPDPDPTPQPDPAPTTKQDCKNGGFKTFTALAFRNQGDCVSFVATGGRNRPSGATR